MKKVTITTPLEDFNDDWGGTYHNGEEQPFPDEVILKDGQDWGIDRGEIERVIKENANMKFGAVIATTDRTSLMVTVRFFKDQNDADLWEQDSILYQDLVLKQIEFQGAMAPSEYTLAVTVTKAPTTTQIAGVENKFNFVYNSYFGGDTSDLDTEPGYAILKVNDAVKETLELHSGGNAYSFNVGQYIINESNRVVIEVGNAHGKKRTWSYNIQALFINLKFSDNYLNSQSVPKTSNWELILDASGTESTVYIRIDGGTPVVRYHVLGSVTFSIDANDTLSFGKHTIEAWAIDSVYGMRTPTIITHFIKAGGSDTVLTLGTNPPTEVSMYDRTEVPFYLYAPTLSVGDTMQVDIQLKDPDNNVISHSTEDITIDENLSSGLQYAVVCVMDNECAGKTLTLEITAGGVSITHDIVINETDIVLQHAAECKVYYNLGEKTNSDTDVVANNMESTYEGQHTSYLRRSQNFTLNENNGFVHNLGGFLIPVNRFLTLEDWQPFATDFGANGSQTGKTINIAYEAGVSSNNDSPIISCMDDWCGFAIYPNRVEVKHGGILDNIYTYYPEGKRVNFALVIDGTTKECVNDDGNGHREITYKNLAYLFMNGVMVRIFEYQNESWEQHTHKNIVFGSTESHMIVYTIAGWDKNIKMKEVIDNLAYDTPSIDDKKAIAKRNNILLADGETIDINKLSTALPNTPIITWWAERLPTNKKDPQTCTETVFDNPSWDEVGKPCAPFTAGPHEINGDGTSSNAYPLPYKNWAEKYSGLTLHLIEGDEFVQKYSITYGVEAGEKKFVHKVNFASSEGIFNILAMNMYQDLLLSSRLTVDDILSKQQQEQDDLGHNITFRKSLSGFPEIGLRKYTDNGEVVTRFLSIYNFINNKKTGSMFGMVDDYKVNQLWEIDENRNFFNVKMTEHTVVGGEVIESNGVRENEPLYYSRVPADSPVNGGDLGMCADITQVTQANDEIKALRHIHNWLYTVNPNVAKRYYARYGEYRPLTVEEDGWTEKDWGDGTVHTTDTPQYRAGKFINEYSDHLHLNDCIFYFVFCQWILGKDSFDKNMSLFLDTVTSFYSDDPAIAAAAKVKLRIMLRDTDTTNLFNNTGVLIYKYWHEWNDTYNESTGETGYITGEAWDGSKYVVQSSVAGASPVFNGRLSGLWDAIAQFVPNNVRDIYQKMRRAGLDAETMMAMYKRFHNYWCEVLYNVDGLGYANTGNLDMAYGDKYLLSEYFYKYRERYMDSKYGVVEYAPRVTMRLSEAPAGVWMKHYTPIYASFNYGAGSPVVTRSIVPGQAALVPCNSESFFDAVCYLNDSDFVTEFGAYSMENNVPVLKGVEGFGDGFHFDQAGFATLARLQKFIWENTQAHPNIGQTTLNGNIDFSQLSMLRELVMTYCVNWRGNVNIGSEIIEKVDFRGTPIGSINIPSAESLEELRLPDSLTSINIKNTPNLDTFSIDGIDSLTTLNLEGVPLVFESIIDACIAIVNNGGVPALKTGSGTIVLDSMDDTLYGKILLTLGDEVFDDNNSLKVKVKSDAEPSVSIGIDKAVVEGGDTIHVCADLLPAANVVSKEFKLFENSTEIEPVDGIATSSGGTTLNVATGEMVTVTNVAETLSVKAVVTTDEDTYISDALEVVVHVYTYPTSVSIEGDFLISESGDNTYIKSFEGTYTAELLRIDWSLSGGDGKVILTSQNVNQAIISADDVTNELSIATLTCTAVFTTGKTVIATYPIEIQTIAFRAVDLGLPSGTKWANMNIGATSPDEAGLYFQWGDTIGYESAAAMNTTLGRTDGYTQDAYNALGLNNISANLSLSDDAAHEHLGGNWRMPTSADFVELNNNCISVWTTYRGMTGRLFTSNINGKSVFLPAAGFYGGTSLRDNVVRGIYWSSTFYDASRACYFIFYSDSIYPQGNGTRWNGLTMRAVSN